MSNTKFADEFIKLKPKYEKLGLNVQQALVTLLNENDIPYLSIKYRIKEQISFLEKIDRKKYKNPFHEIEDICGVRIICYFQNDIEKIQEIILKEFNISENQSKQELLNATEFGYRSTHLIAKIKDEWTSTPTYRELNNLKFEIQIRTILMHSWAEIEHKLAYKSESDIPKELRRKFSFISAVLEDADIKFEEIKNQIEKNKAELINKAHIEDRFDESTELNLDTLQAFLDYAFENRVRDIEDTRSILNEMKEFNIPFKKLILGFEKARDILNLIENEETEVKRALYHSEYLDENDIDPVYWHQTGAVRTLLDLIDDKYFNSRLDNPSSDVIKKYREKL